MMKECSAQRCAPGHPVVARTRQCRDSPELSSQVSSTTLPIITDLESRLGGRTLWRTVGPANEIPALCRSWVSRLPGPRIRTKPQATCACANRSASPVFAVVTASVMDFAHLGAFWPKMSDFAVRFGYRMPTGGPDREAKTFFLSANGEAG